MKPSKQHFDISKDVEVILNHIANEATIKDQETSIFLPFEAFLVMAEIASEIRPAVPQLVEKKRVTTQREAESEPAQSERTPAAEKAKHDHANSINTNLANLDNLISSMWVIGMGGQYYPNRVEPGQSVKIDAPIDRARLFSSAEEAAAAAQYFPGVEIKLFADVGLYRIGIAQPDGNIGFWVGNNQPISHHPNNSCTVNGRAAALSTLSTVQPPQGCSALLIPVTS